MTKPDLKTLVGGTVSFEFYRAGNLWYRTDAEHGAFAFPVPLTDIGNATFLATDKAMLFMRYIRKQLAIVDTTHDPLMGVESNSK